MKTEEYSSPSGSTPEELPTDGEILRLLFMLFTKFPEEIDQDVIDEMEREYSFLHHRMGAPRARLQRRLTPELFRMMVERRRILREELRKHLPPLRFKMMAEGRLSLE